MGRRNRQREKLAAPSSDYRDADGNVLTLRGSLSPATRLEYASLRGGGLNRDDAEQRAVEFLFEHLAKSWTIAGAGMDRQKELVGRYRMASGPERQFVREALRQHLEANFPDVPTP